MTQNCKDLIPDLSQHFQKYKYASFVLSKDVNHQKIKDIFLKHNIECSIAAPFKKLPLKSSHYMSILFHNAEYSQIYTLVLYNPLFFLQGKPMIVIFLTRYIKLKDRSPENHMPDAQLIATTSLLKKAFPNEVLKMWKFINANNQQEFYLESGSIYSSFYVGMLMTQIKEKTSFMNPVGLEGMSEEERQARFRLCYSSGCL